MDLSLLYLAELLALARLANLSSLPARHSRESRGLFGCMRASPLALARLRAVFIAPARDSRETASGRWQMALPRRVCVCRLFTVGCVAPVRVSFPSVSVESPDSVHVVRAAVFHRSSV